MASTSGLSRRRGAQGAKPEGGALAPSSTQPSLSPSHSRPTSPLSAPGQPSNASPVGHKVAYDERDLNNSEDERVNPRLTLMEEVLLLGLKDKQASPTLSSVSGQSSCAQRARTRSRHSMCWRSAGSGEASWELALEMGGRIDSLDELRLSVQEFLAGWHADPASSSHRATSPSGTTTSRTLSAAASSSNSHCDTESPWCGTRIGVGFPSQTGASSPLTFRGSS